MKILCSPCTEDVELYIVEKLKTNSKILHIVPTKILEVRRRGFYKSFYRIEGDKEKTQKDLESKGIYVYELNTFMRYLLSNFNIPILTNHESKILINRVIMNNEEIANITWERSIAELQNIFFQFNLSNLPIDELYRLSEDKSWKNLINIYVDYREELKNKNLLDESTAFLKCLSITDFNKYDTIYFDGAFLPFTPLLSQLINVIKKQTTNINFFIPFNIDQQNNPKYKALIQIYQEYVNIKNWQCIRTPKKSYSVINDLAHNFQENDHKIYYNDNTFQVNKYKSLEDEIDDVVQKAIMYIETKITRPEKIAIVTPQVMEYRSLVREAIEVHKKRLEKEKRPLIDLKIGKFLSLIYQIIIDDRINVFEIKKQYIDYEIFRNILHQNILLNSDELLKIYSYIEIFFKECITFDCWLNTIDSLIKGKKEITTDFSYHPLFHLTIEELKMLKQSIKYLQKLTINILNSKEKPTSEHIKSLLVLINKLMVEKDDINHEEYNEIKEKLTSYSVYLKNNEDIIINSKEFGRKLHSILNDNNLERNNEEELENIFKITVTGINNIEYQKYDYIFMIRFTQNNYPEIPKRVWPNTLDIEYKLLKNSTLFPAEKYNDLLRFHLDLSLYYIFIVMNSVQKKLYISYSEIYDDIPQTPSHYLMDMASLLIGEKELRKLILDEEKKKKNIIDRIEEKLEKLNILREPSRMKTKKHFYNISNNSFYISEPSVISAEDLYIYSKCPRRFIYENKYPDQRIFTDGFQLKFYATAYLFEYSIIYINNIYKNINKDNFELINHELNKIIETSSTSLRNLFPFSRRDWEDVKFATLKKLKNFMKHHIKPNLNYNIKLLKVNHKEIEEINNITIERIIDFKILFFDINTDRVLKSKNYYVSPDKILLGSKKGFYKLFNEKGRNKKDKLKNLTNNILLESFPKNNGSHCKYCPSKLICLGEVNKR